MRAGKKFSIITLVLMGMLLLGACGQAAGKPAEVLSQVAAAGDSAAGQMSAAEAAREILREEL